MAGISGGKPAFFSWRTLIWGLAVILAFGLLGALLGRISGYKTAESLKPAGQEEEARRKEERLRERVISLAAAKEGAVSAEARAVWAELQKAADQMEEKAYRQRGSLGEAHIFRQVKWWMSQEEVLKSEEAQSDTRLLAQNLQPNPAVPVQPVLVYRLTSEEGGQEAQLIYMFGRVTGGLNSIVVSFFPDPAVSAEAGEEVWLELKKTLGPAPAASRGPGGGYDFWYDEWRDETRRVSVARARHNLPGGVLVQVSALYTIPGYGDEEDFPLEVMRSFLETFSRSQAP